MRVVVGLVLRFGLVQPEGPDARLVVVLPALLPHELACRGVGGVVEDRGLLEAHLHVDAGLGAHEQVRVAHLLVVLRRERDLGPHRDHELDAHGRELGDRGRRVREVLLVEAEVPHPRPVEEVADDHVERQSPAPVLAGHLEQLLGVPIAQLALPEAESVLRHRRRAARRRGVRAHDLCGRVAGGDPVVELAGRRGVPLRPVPRERRPADARVVPEEPVPRAGQHERHARLGVAVRQLERAALEVEQVLLVPTHPEQLLAGVGHEGRRHGVVAAGDRVEPAGLQPQAATGRQLREQVPAVRAPELELAPRHVDVHVGGVVHADGP